MHVVAGTFGPWHDDALSFESFYRREHDRVLGVLCLVGGECDLAREATDEAFARTLAQWPKVSAMEFPGAWVRRVAINVLHRIHRRRELEARVLQRQYTPASTIDEWPEVWQAVNALTDRQRTAVVLRFVADLPEAEIALVMGINRGTVSSTLASARRRLATHLRAGNEESAVA